MGIHANFLEKLPCLFGRSNKMYQILDFQHKIAIGNEHLSSPFHRADQNVQAQLCADF